MNHTSPKAACFSLREPLKSIYRVPIEPLVVKMAVRHHSLFTNKDMVWNMLDTVLVAGAMYDMFLTFLSPSESNNGSGFIGAIRGS